MSSYLFVESRDPFASRDVEEGYRLLAGASGTAYPRDVVPGPKRCPRSPSGCACAQFTTLVAHPGVTVLADTFALQDVVFLPMRWCRGAGVGHRYPGRSAHAGWPKRSGIRRMGDGRP